jgi:hypothetical protein
VPTLTPMSLARLTVDLMRPVPVGAPLTVATRVAREGKKLQIVELALLADGVECVLASALRLREADLVGETGYDLPRVPPTTAPPSGSLRPRRRSTSASCGPMPVVPCSPPTSCAPPATTARSPPGYG